MIGRKMSREPCPTPPELICNIVHVLAYKCLHHKYATHSTVSKPRVKCPGVNPRYANAPPPGRATLGNAPGLPGGMGTAGID